MSFISSYIICSDNNIGCASYDDYDTAGAFQDLGFDYPSSPMLMIILDGTQNPITEMPFVIWDEYFEFCKNGGGRNYCDAT